MKRVNKQNPFYIFWLGLRSTLFMAGLALSTIIAGLLTPVLYIIPKKYRYNLLMFWTYFNIYSLKVVCGVNYQIKGVDDIDLKENAILLANHQSSWETMYFPTVFPNMSWVIKRELYRIPFYGWALPALEPIAIDRSAGRSAVEQVKVNGKERLDQGHWVCIFPEGTRVEPGKKVRYKMGGAILASYSEYPVYPVAHNAGECWPRHSYLKYPGLITISVGPKINTKGLEPNQINEQVREWIEAEQKKLPAVR